MGTWMNIRKKWGKNIHRIYQLPNIPHLIILTRRGDVKKGKLSAFTALWKGERGRKSVFAPSYPCFEWQLSESTHQFPENKHCPDQTTLEFPSYSVPLGYAVELPLWWRWVVLLGIFHKDPMGRNRRISCSSPSGLGLWQLHCLLLNLFSSHMPNLAKGWMRNCGNNY